MFSPREICANLVRMLVVSQNITRALFSYIKG
jgi:hypothetical protein